MDAVDKNGLVLPVSLWIKRLERDGEPRCLVVMEPVERTVATVRFDANVSTLRTMGFLDNVLFYGYFFNKRMHETIVLMVLLLQVSSVTICHIN